MFRTGCTGLQNHLVAVNTGLAPLLLVRRILSLDPPNEILYHLRPFLILLGLGVKLGWGGYLLVVD